MATVKRKYLNDEGLTLYHNYDTVNWVENTDSNNNVTSITLSKGVSATVEVGGDSVTTTQRTITIPLTLTDKYISSGVLHGPYASSSEAITDGVPSAIAQAASYPAYFLQLILSDSSSVWIDVTNLHDELTYTADNTEHDVGLAVSNDHKLSADLKLNEPTDNSALGTTLQTDITYTWATTESGGTEYDSTLATAQDKWLAIKINTISASDISGIFS